MKIFLFIISYILLDIIGSVFYVGALLFLFKVLQKIFHMDQDKWNTLFKFGGGKGFYFMMLSPYVLMLGFMFLISKAWFEWLAFKYSMLDALGVVVVLTFIMARGFPKLQDIVNNKVQETIE